MMLYLRGSPSMGGKEVEVPLDNPHATVFSYVQSLVLHGATGPNKNDRLRRVWEPNFTYAWFHFRTLICLNEVIRSHCVLISLELFTNHEKKVVLTMR